MKDFWDIIARFDYTTYIFCALGLMVVTIIIQISLKFTYAKYSKIGNSRGMTGAQAAQAILDAYGVTDVSIQPIAGNLTDNYNPKTKVLSLSQGVYGSSSVAAVGVAAHEAGHAIQHSREYLPVKLRSALVPVANIGSRFSWILIIIGVLLSTGAEYSSIGYYLAIGGLVLFLFAVLFTLVTLPVEYNASRRAKKILAGELAMDREDIKGVKKVLGAAALTYVASLASALLTMLRMLSIVGGSRRR